MLIMHIYLIKRKYFFFKAKVCIFVNKKKKRYEDKELDPKKYENVWR